MIDEKKLAEAFEKIKKDNEKIKEEIKNLKEENKALSSEINSLKKVPTKQPVFQKDLIKKINRHRKDIVKQKILDVIKTRHVSLIELKEIVVDREQYCSKASFYRYVEDLKDQVSTNRQKVLVIKEL